jgi:hypothetical protein
VAAEEVESCIIMNEEPVDVKREDIITKSKKKNREKERERERERERRYPRSKMLSILCCCQ